MSYSIDFINKIKVSGLTNIPETEKFKTFASYIKKYGSVEKQDYILPLYLQNRYGNACISRTTLKKKKKLFNDTGHIKEEVSKILSKLSKSNKEIIFKDFFKLEITDDNIEEVAKCIYERSVDLTYLNTLYVELIIGISTENTALFTEIIDIILNKLIKPDTFQSEEKTKKWMKSCAILVGELILQLKSEVPFNISNIIEILKSNKMTESILLILKTSKNIELISKQEDYLNMVYINRKESESLRYTALDILELLE